MQGRQTLNHEETETGVKLYPKRIRFTSANLAYTLQDLASDDKYQAICIIHGPFRDDYAMLDFCTAQVVEAMVKVKKPIFTGLGHPSDTPLICGFADYDAATTQELAIKIAVLRASHWMDLMQKKIWRALKASPREYTRRKVSWCIACIETIFELVKPVHHEQFYMIPLLHYRTMARKTGGNHVFKKNR